MPPRTRAIPPVAVGACAALLAGAGGPPAPTPEPKPEPSPAADPEPADRGPAAEPDPEPVRPEPPAPDVKEGSTGAGRNVGEGRVGTLTDEGNRGRSNTGAGAGDLSVRKGARGGDGAKRRDGRRHHRGHGAGGADAGLLPGGYAISLPATIRTIGVRKGAIDGFDIPVFLLPIYRAASERYGIPWEILAAINAMETEYGRNLAVSSAGARGWMQFMPGTWATYGVDANRDGRRDPNDPVDAIFAAARYLRAAGAPADMGAALYAYNHAHWYVRGVVARARSISVMQGALAESLTTLADGRSPVPDRSPAYRRSQGGVLIAAPGGSRVERRPRTCSCASAPPAATRRTSIPRRSSTAGPRSPRSGSSAPSARPARRPRPRRPSSAAAPSRAGCWPTRR